MAENDRRRSGPRLKDRQRPVVASAEPLLRVPPFPGAPPAVLAVPAAGSTSDLTDQEIDALIAAFREGKVGGTYWAARPKLPADEYSLVRVSPVSRREP